MNYLSSTFGGQPRNKPMIGIKHYDPMCCLIRLGLLNYQRQKIRFEETRISFRSCDLYGALQSAWDGNSYLYLKDLETPLNEAAVLYPPDEQTELGKAIKVIYKKAISGLEELKTIYHGHKRDFKERQEAEGKIDVLTAILHERLLVKEKKKIVELKKVSDLTKRSHDELWAGDNCRKLIVIANQFLLHDLKRENLLPQIKSTLNAAENQHEALVYKS